MKTGIVVMYNCVEYLVTRVDREFGKVTGLWCDNLAGDEAFFRPSDVEVL